MSRTFLDSLYCGTPHGSKYKKSPALTGGARGVWGVSTLFLVCYTWDGKRE
jgi:hypothetical protein